MKYIVTDSDGNEYKTDSFEAAFYKSFELKEATILNTETKELKEARRGKKQL